MPLFSLKQQHICVQKTHNTCSYFSSGTHMVAINNKGDDPKIITETCVANLKSIKMIVSFPKASNRWVRIIDSPMRDYFNKKVGTTFSPFLAINS